MSEPSPCPPPEVLQDLLLGRLSAEAAAAAEQHLEQCEPCSASLATLRGADRLTAAVRRPVTPFPVPEPEVVDALVSRFKHLGPPDHQATRPAPTAVSNCAVIGPFDLGDGPGPRLGPYRLVRQLGEGGMGFVYLAEDEHLRRPVALKVMRPELARNDKARQRFVREARAMASLKSDHVVTVYQVGQEEDTPYLAMEFLEGETLAARMARQPALGLSEAVRIAQEAALGLAAAHAAGLVHRDIKPANIFLERLGRAGDRDSGQSADQPAERNDPDEASPPGRDQALPAPAPPAARIAYRVKILDFGLARPTDGEGGLTRTGGVVGTPAYMPLEQAKGGQVDARADLYSLGCVLYEMCTGRRPVQGLEAMAILVALLQEVPPPLHELNPDVPPALSDLVMRLLSRWPDDRPASARVVAESLRAIAANLPAPAAAVGPIETPHCPTPSAPTWPARRGRQPAAGLTRRQWLLTAWLAAFGIGSLAGYAWFHKPHPGPAGAGRRDHYAGWIDLRIGPRAGEGWRERALGDPGVLPLRPGDEVRIDAEVEAADFLYVFWLDAAGRVEPVYPWRPARWGTRPGRESPRRRLSLPETPAGPWRITGPAAGMETVLLLVRDSPLTLDDAAVQQLFADLPTLSAPTPGTAVWFENGTVVRDEDRRQPLALPDPPADAPLLELHRQLHARLQPHAAYTRAVSFARQGP